MISGTKRSEKEYRRLDRLSSSNIRMYATKGRKEFYLRVVKREKPEETYNRSLKIGNIVHCKVLEPENFDKKFYVSVCEKVPTGNMLAFVEALYKHTVINTEDGEVKREFKYLAEEAYKDSGYKWKLERVLKEFKGDPENYYRDLRKASSGDKELACLEDISIADKIRDKLTTHDFTKHIFEEEAGKEYLNEYQTEFIFRELPMKAMIDRLKIDHEYKIIWPFDLKIVWDNENFVQEYFLKQRADIQAYIYDYALEQAFPGYEVKPLQFVVADSTNFNAPLVYPCTPAIIHAAYQGFKSNGEYYPGIKEIVEDIKWYQETGEWHTSYKAYKNNGIIPIE